MQEKPRRIALGMTVPPSTDKVYIIGLTKMGDRWMVMAHYGKRGRANSSAYITKTPTSYEEAEYAFSNMVEKKINNGYSIEND